MNNPFDMRGRVAVITGGTQGVGGAIACSLAAAGADLVLQGLRDDDQAQETVRRCRENGAAGQIRVDCLFMGLLPTPVQSSVTPIVDQLFEQAILLRPDIDTLVNNVGTYLDRNFVDLDADTYYRTMQLNVAIGLFLTRRFAGYWIERKVAGRVLFTGSINGLLSEPQHVVYDATKAAVAGMVRSLCVELAPHNIRVNAMAPGLVVTPLTQVVDDDPEIRAWMELHTPNRRVPGPEVCGPPAVFLLSDAAEHVHGQTLYVDGGMSTWQQPNPPAITG